MRSCGRRGASTFPSLALRGASELVLAAHGLISGSSPDVVAFDLAVQACGELRALRDAFLRRLPGRLANELPKSG